MLHGSLDGRGTWEIMDTFIAEWIHEQLSAFTGYLKLSQHC